MASTAVQSSQLWIGGLEHFMNEHLLMNAFIKNNEKPAAARVMRAKQTGEIIGYGFVHFHSEEEAKRVLQKLNGKPMPNSSTRFRLNVVKSNGQKVNATSDNLYSLWVGDLSLEVDELAFYKTFASRYQSIVVATVVLDTFGNSKGFGFIRFHNEEDEKHCLTNMNGYKGLGSKPLRISSAHRASVTVGTRGYYSNTDYCNTLEYKDVKTSAMSGALLAEKRTSLSNQELTYWHSYMSWQPIDECNSNGSYKFPQELLPQMCESVVSNEDDLDLIEHNTKLDIESLNKDLIQRDYNFWDALECSKWTPVECYE